MKNIALVISVIAVLMVMSAGTAIAACSACSGGATSNPTHTGWKGKLFNDTFRQELKQNASHIRDQLQNCTENESDECNETRDEAINLSRYLLKDVAGRLCTKLDTIEDRINKIEKLTDEEKDAILDAIDEAKEKCAELEGKIDAATNKSEIKEIISEIRSLVNSIHAKAVEMIKLNRIGLIIERAEHLETRLNKTIENAKAENLSTDELEALVDGFNAKIADARSAYDESKALWTQVFGMIANKTTEGRPELIQQAQEKKQEAQTALKEAHVILKDIIAKIREMKLQVPENETEENETE